VDDILQRLDHQKTRYRTGCGGDEHLGVSLAVIALSMAISGILAGLAGAHLSNGLLKQLTLNLSPGIGFEGIVVSDWEAVIDRVAGVKAGMHLEMPGRGLLEALEVASRPAAGVRPRTYGHHRVRTSLDAGSPEAGIGPVESQGQ